MSDLVPLDGSEAAALFRLEETIERGLATFFDEADWARAQRGLPPCEGVTEALAEFERLDRGE